MARVSITAVRKAANSFCNIDENPAACRRGVAHAIDAFKREKGKKRKANPEAAKRLEAWRKCAAKAGVEPFTKPTPTQRNEIDRCLGRR